MDILSRKIAGICATSFLFFGLVACGSGGSPSSDPSTTPDVDSTAVDVNTLDGKSEIPVDSSFKYTFANAVDTSTVGMMTFFIVPSSNAATTSVKATYDPAICDQASSLSAVVTCSSDTACTLDPSQNLENDWQYTICLSSSIELTLGGAFEGFMATFTTMPTVDPLPPAAPTVTLKLIRLDGTKLNLTDKPIPLRVSVEATFDQAMNPATVEGAMSIADSDGIAVPSTFSWNEDNTIVTCSLSQNLKPKKTYHVKIAETAATKGTLSPVDQSFTTMTRGDVNGDGYADLVVGAYQTNVAGGSADGSVYIFSGATISKASQVADAFATIDSTEGSAQFGYAVSASGDIDGDGYADVLASAYKSASGGTERGAAYIFSGATLSGAKTTADALATCAGLQDNNKLGTSAIILHDINNDGYDEAAVASPSLNSVNGSSGAIYIFAGGPALSGVKTRPDAYAAIIGANSGDQLGYSMANAGDIDGDGTPDIATGAIGFDTGRGATYVFSGAALTGTITANAMSSLAMIAGASAGDHFGNSVAGPGDINGDAHDDLATTAVGYDAGEYRGAAYFFDGASLSAAKTAGDNFSRILGNASNDQMGYDNKAISGAGDFDSDGKVDIVVGAAGAPGGPWEGVAYVFRGSDLVGNKAASDAFANIAAPAGHANELSGYVSGGGDLDGDGVPDFVIGAIGYDSGEYFGAAYVFSGAAIAGTTTLNDAMATIVGTNKDDNFGVVSAQ